MIWSFSKSANFDLVSSSASTVSIEMIPSSVWSSSFSYNDEHDSISIRSETVDEATFSLALVDVDGDGDGDDVDIDDDDCILEGIERGWVGRLKWACWVNGSIGSPLEDPELIRFLIDSESGIVACGIFAVPCSCSWARLWRFSRGGVWITLWRLAMWLFKYSFLNFYFIKREHDWNQVSTGTNVPSAHS